MHGDEVDAEWPGRPLLRLGDLSVEQVRRHGPAGDDAEAASVGDGGDEVALRNPAHRAAHDGDLAAEQIGTALHQALQAVAADAVGCIVLTAVSASRPSASWMNRPARSEFSSGLSTQTVLEMVALERLLMPRSI